MRGWHGGGSSNNTHIGFEICEDGLTDPAYFSAVYKEAVDLCVYLCKQYGLTEKNIICHCEGYKQGIASNHGDVMHWFPKYGKSMDTFRADVKSGLASVETPVEPDKPTDTEKTIWDKLYAFLGNPYSTAGLMGNLYAESGLRPNNLQNAYEKKLGMSDTEYTAAVDNGNYGNFVRDSAGYGIAQWTFWSRKQALLDYARAAGKSIGDLETQLGFLCKELTGYAAVLKTLKAATSVKEASDIVLTQFERPSDQSDAVKAKRTGYGQVYCNKYAPAKTETPIGIINDFIALLNKLPGVSIDAIATVTFGTTAQLENAAATAARNADLQTYRSGIEAGIADRDASLNSMITSARAATADREANIASLQAANTAQDSTDLFDYGSAIDQIGDNAADTAANTAATADALDYAEEDLQYLRDIAEREAINRFTTAEVKVDMTGMTNKIDSEMDIDGIFNQFGEKFAEVLDVSEEGVHE